jgi:hypothetical protein
MARAFGRTLVFSIRHPTRFYGLIPSEKSLLPAIAYGFVFQLGVALATLVYTKAVGAADLDASLKPLLAEMREIMPNLPELVGKTSSASAIASFVLCPVTYLVDLFLSVSLTWVGLRIVGGLKTTFERLLRLFAYASWIQVFGLISVTGDIVLSLVGSLLVLGVGSYYWLLIVRESQQIDTRRAIYASLVGCLIALGCGCICGLPVLGGLTYLLMTMP